MLLLQWVEKKSFILKTYSITVGRTKPGTNVNARVFRDGKYISVNVKIGTFPNQESNETAPEVPKNPSLPLGLELGSLQDERELLEDTEGVRVLEVLSSSPAFGRLFRGDIITEVKAGNTSFKITSIEDFKNALDSFDTGDIILIIGNRNGTNIFEPVEIE